ncbi:MAG: hypothetical protein QOK42_159 [Frankiaceae bacterium]|jgi:hypothetical protein|nr:hypothetical protein [Frankiaceae bacterium]MDX6224466.1 hypothetical protein [Frankiales bacterium]MDX6274760.1 hypothetical protein [Frankiales bacterium]
MIRVTNECEVKYGHFAEYLEICEELDQAMIAKKFKPWSNLTPLTGKGNVIVQTCDYDSLQEMTDEQNRFYADADLMKTFRRGAELVVQGSASGMIYEEAPHLA